MSLSVDNHVQFLLEMGIKLLFLFVFLLLIAGTKYWPFLKGQNMTFTCLSGAKKWTTFYSNGRQISRPMASMGRQILYPYGDLCTLIFFL